MLNIGMKREILYFFSFGKREENDEKNNLQKNDGRYKDGESCE